MSADDRDSWQPRDDHDAVTVIPALEPEPRSRLARSLAADHPWQTLISGHRAHLAATTAGCSGDVRLLDSGQSSQTWEFVTDDSTRVVRVPIPNSGRLLSYRSEMKLGELLATKGHPVARWSIVAVDDVECSVGLSLPGFPVDYSTVWADGFVEAFADLLRDLHRLDVAGWGPLQNRSDALVGASTTAIRGVIARWFHAPIWPFSEIELRDHPVAALGPNVVAAIAALSEPILAAAGAPFGVVHSDLHRKHLLHVDGELTAVLDFGDAFVGSVAWDFGLVRWYYGEHNTARLAAEYGPAGDLARRGALLAVAVGCYKMAKSPGNELLGPQLLSLLDEVGTSS